MIRFDRCLFFGWDLWFSHILFHKVCTQNFMASSYLMVDRKKIAPWRQFQLDIPSIYSFHFQGICLDSSSLILRVPSRVGFSPVMWVVPFIFVWNQGVWGGKYVSWSNPCLKQRDSGLVPLGIHPQCQDPSSWWSSKEHYHAVGCPSCLKNTESSCFFWGGRIFGPFWVKY